MFLRFLVIVDSYQEKISCIATQRIRLVPLQLHNKRRIVISVLRFWNENEVCEAPACGQLSNRLKVILHSAQVCNRQDAAQGVFIVVLDGRNIVIMDFLNSCWNSNISFQCLLSTASVNSCRISSFGTNAVFRFWSYPK